MARMAPAGALPGWNPAAGIPGSLHSLIGNPPCFIRARIIKNHSQTALGKGIFGILFTVEDKMTEGQQAGKSTECFDLIKVRHHTFTAHPPVKSFLRVYSQRIMCSIKYTWKRIAS